MVRAGARAGASVPRRTSTMPATSQLLVAGILVPFSDVRFVPGHGVLDSVWLGANAVLLLGVIAACLRLGRGKDAHRVTL